MARQRFFTDRSRIKQISRLRSQTLLITITPALASQAAVDLFHFRGYERYFEAQGKKWSHIFDLTTGYPCETDLVSVTVIGQSGIETDFLSTCIFIGGSGELDRWLSDEDIEVIAINENGIVYCSDSIKSRISISDDKFRFE